MSDAAFVLWDHKHGGVITDADDEGTMRGYVRGYVYRRRMPDWLSLTVTDDAGARRLTGETLLAWLDAAPDDIA